MIAIAAVDKNWGIGYKGDLLQKLPEDMKSFVQKTKGQVIVLGRKTLDSFKDGRPLPDRVNIVLTRQKDFKREGCVMCRDFDELFELLEIYPGEIYVCGGGEIYKELLPYCDKAYITKFEDGFEADTYFSNLDEEKEWELTQDSEWILSSKGTKFKFTEYNRKI